MSVLAERDHHWIQPETVKVPPRVAKLWDSFKSRFAFRRYQAKHSTRKIYAKLAPATLTIFGLGSFSIAAFQVGIVQGFLVLGASFFYLEWRVDK